MVVYAIDVLSEHGIGEADVAVLRRWFGPTLPEMVDGPGGTIKWAMSLLPWTQLHPLLRRWLEDAVSKGIDLGDTRLQAVLDLLVDEPDGPTAADVQSRILEVATTYARLYGAPVNETGAIEVLATDVDANPTVRMWTGALPVTDAVMGASQGIKGDRRMVDASFAALFLLMEPESAGRSRNVIVDGAVQDVVRALCDYVSTWTGSWK